ncbi:MAG: UPF0236 family protein [Methylococcales bacterium]|nr:UPF0236 family protein [Methylococcales bacterium]
MQEKKLWWHSTFDIVEIEETLFREETHIVRTFSDQAGVTCRSTSTPLQRAITDFGADQPFGQVNAKLQEHYGIEVPVSCIRLITEHHGKAIFEQTDLVSDWPDTPGAKYVIAETDGGMVPVVTIDPEAKDKRKGKTLGWQELRLCIAHEFESRTLHYGGNFSGGIEETGRQLFGCAMNANFGKQTHLHSVGDGASWIKRQVDEQFGENGTYLIDLMHLCEYLAEAAPSCTGDTTLWLDEQKQRLKTNQASLVLETLWPFLEPPETDDEKAPVRKAYRYLRNRLDQVDYQGATTKGLPIGSGEIESAHRYVVQARLKRPGAWWSPNNIDYMLALRLCRINQRWENYWQGVRQKAA